MQTEYKSLLARDEILAFVNNKYQTNKSVDEVLRTDPYYRFIRIVELLKTLNISGSKDEKWLDLGCHHGQFLSLINYNFDFSLIGMDDWNLKDAMPFVNFEYYAVNLANKWIDKVEAPIKCISALEVIEHIIDTEKFLENIRSILVDEGYLILSTPNINSLRNRIMIPFGKYPAFLEYKNIIHHVRLFNKGKLISLLAEQGFLVEKVIGVSFFPERFLKVKLLRNVSEALANAFPSFCGNLIVVAKKMNG